MKAKEGKDVKPAVQIYKYMCPFCRRREATQFCDFIVGYARMFASGKNGFVEDYHETCNVQMCKECANLVGGSEFCPDCNKLHGIVKAAYAKNSKGKLRMYIDSIYESSEEHES